jgi:hypothetical protein
MRNLWIWSTQALSRILDSGERETVLGDLAELGVSGHKAFKGVLGLVLRRQIGLWKEWEPWFVLWAIVVPVGPLLTRQANGLELRFLPNLVMWFHYGISYRTGVSSPALFAEFCFQASALITWSWTSTFALGVLSRKTIWVNGVLFFLWCAVFALDHGFYPFRFLGATNFLIILLPAYFGIRKSIKSPRTKPRWLVPLVGWTGIIGGLSFWTEGWSGAALDNWSHGAPALTLLQLAQRADVWENLGSHLIAVAVLTGPIVYLLVKPGPEQCLS